MHPKKIKSFRRFKQNTNSDRPPPILIQLHGENNRPLVLKASKELRNKNEFRDVYINPDLAEAERILEKKRREDRYNLNQIEKSKFSNFRYRITGDGFRRFTVEPNT